MIRGSLVPYCIEPCAGHSSALVGEKFMATQSSFKQQCPSCEAMVPIRDPKLIGRKIDCPKCKYRFVVEEPVDEVEEVEEEVPGKKGKPDGITNKKPVNGKAAKAPAGRRPDDDEDEEPKPKKKQGGSGMLIAGIALAAVAVIALAVGAVFLFTGDSDDDKGSRRPSASAPSPTTDNTPVAEKKDNGPAGPKPRQEDITNLLPNDTQVVVNLPLEHLLLNAKVNQALLKTPGAFHEAAFQNIWGIPPTEVRRVVLAYNAEKKTVFSVMRTSVQLKEDQIVTRLRLKEENPINGFKLYLVKKPLDALSTLLLKGGAYHDKVALHFMDQFTVVCADVGPMNQFLKEKEQPKQLSTQPVEQEQGGGGPQGMQGMMQGRQGGGMQGGPPGGMQGGPQRPGGGQQQPGPGGNGPPGGAGGKPNPMAGMGSPGSQPPGAGGFQPPSGMPGGMTPTGMTGGGSTAGAAPFSSSYMTIDPHLKSVLDQAEKLDKNENQNVLLSLALSTSSISVDALKKLMAQQGGNVPQVPDFGLKFALEAMRSQLKAVGVAVTEFSDSKVAVNTAVGAKDDNLAQTWEKAVNDAVPGVLLMSGLDLVAKNAGRNNMPGPQPGGMMPGMQGGMMGMQGGGMQGMQGGMQQQMQMEMQRRRMQGGMQGGPPGMPPLGGVPGIQPPQGGEKQEEKGKLGNYEIWTKDSVLAVGINFNISQAQFALAGEGLEFAGIFLRGVMAMSDRSSRIHELAAATQAYLEAKGHFPRGTTERSSDSSRSLYWRPDQRVSWMNELLPYLANGEYKDIQVESKKPWYEDQFNEKAGLTVIPQFVASIPSENPMYFYVPYPNLPVKGHGLWAATNFVGMAGVGLDAAEYRADDPATAKKRGVFGYDRETKKTDIKDGLDQTIVLIQVPPEPKSPWIAGGGSTVRGISEDLDCVQPFVSTEYEGKRGTFAIMADGKVRFIPATIDPKTFQAMCTIAGGDKIKNLDTIAPEVTPPEELTQPELKAEPDRPAPLPAVPAPEAAAKPAGWKEFTSKGGFKFSLPSSGKVIQQDLQVDSPVGKLNVHIHGVELPKNAGAFMTIYSDYPDAVLKGGADNILDGAKAGVTGSLKGAKISSESKIKFQGHPGRVWTIDIAGKGTMKARVFLVKNRLIQLLAGSESGKAVEEKDVQAFFDSFKLIGK